MTPFWITRWPAGNALTEDAIHAQFAAEGLVPWKWANRPGDTYPPHVHSYHKVLYVVEGDIAWQLPEHGERVVTSAGDRIDLSAGVVHSAIVGSSGVTCLEARKE